MRLASEVILLMRPYPGREFRMQQILRGATRTWAAMDAKAKAAARKAVVRVLDELQASGHVSVIPAAGRGSFALYSWVSEK